MDDDSSEESQLDDDSSEDSEDSGDDSEEEEKRETLNLKPSYLLKSLGLGNTIESSDFNFDENAL